MKLLIAILIVLVAIGFILAAVGMYELFRAPHNPDEHEDYVP